LCGPTTIPSQFVIGWLLKFDASIDFWAGEQRAGIYQTSLEASSRQRAVGCNVATFGSSRLRAAKWVEEPMRLFMRATVALSAQTVSQIADHWNRFYLQRTVN
jgi:hypothetical protein